VSCCVFFFEHLHAMEPVSRERATKVVQNLWNSLKCSDVLDAKDTSVVAAVTDQLNCSDSWELIREQRDHGLPIAAVYEKQHRLFSGYFEVVDILVFALRQVANHRRKTVELRDLVKMESLRQMMVDVKLTHVATMSSLCPFLPVKSDSLAVDAVREMLAGIEPVALLDSKSGSHVGADLHELKGLVSGYKVLKHINKKVISNLGPFCDATLAQLGLDTPAEKARKVHTFRWDRTLVSEVFAYMRDNDGVTVVPIVDDEGFLVDQVSMLDIQHLIAAEDFDILEQTLKEFLVTYRPHLSHLRPDFTIEPPDAPGKDSYLEKQQGFALRKSPNVQRRPSLKSTTDGMIAASRIRSHSRRASLPTSGLSSLVSLTDEKPVRNRRHTGFPPTEGRKIGRRASISLSTPLSLQRSRGDRKNTSPDTDSKRRPRRPSMDARNFNKDEADAYIDHLQSFLKPKRSKKWSKGYHISSSDSLESLIDKLYEKEVPALWVVDDADKPIPKALVQPMDILRLFHPDNLEALLDITTRLEKAHENDA
jgi:hypothetical protein